MQYSKIKYFFQLMVLLTVETILFIGSLNFTHLFKFLDYTLQEALFLFLFFGINSLCIYLLIKNSEQEKNNYTNSILQITNCDFSKLKYIKTITIKNKKLCFATEFGDIFIELINILHFDSKTITKIDNLLSNYTDKEKFNSESLSFIIERLIKK